MNKPLFVLLIVSALALLSGCKQEGFSVTDQKIDHIANRIEDISRQVDDIYNKSCDAYVEPDMNTDQSTAFDISEDLQPIPQSEWNNADWSSCVGIKGITALDIKGYSQCVELGNGYCNCIEEYSKCNLALTEIPEMYRYDFKPPCSK